MEIMIIQGIGKKQYKFIYSFRLTTYAREGRLYIWAVSLAVIPIARPMIVQANILPLIALSLIPCLKQGNFPYYSKNDTFIIIVEADNVTVTFRMAGAEQNTKQVIPFDFVPNNYGGERVYFLCPLCGERVRKPYLYHGFFRCRKCAKLNYPSQQVTKGCDAAYLKMRRAVVALDPKSVNLSPHDLFRYHPDRPKGIHHITYIKRLVAFQRAKEEYVRAWRKAVGAILRYCL